MLVKLCSVLSLVDDIRLRSWLRAIHIWRTRHFLPWSWYASICLLTRVIDFDRVPWIPRSLRMRVLRSVHRRSGVNDILLLPKRKWIQRVVVCFKSCSGLPCFGSSRSFIPCHILLRETLLLCFSLPVIIPYASATFDHPCTELAEH